MLQKSRLLLIFSLLSLACSCTSVNYSGPTYPPTTKVEIFYNQNQIKQPYTTMGSATTSTWYTYQNRQIRGAMIEKAKSVGADAILVNSIDAEPTAPAIRDSGDAVHDMMNENRELRPGQFISGANDGKTESMDVSNVSVDFLKYIKK